MTPKERVEDYLKRFCSNDTDMAWHIVNLEDAADAIRADRDRLAAEVAEILTWARRPLPSKSDHNHYQSGLPDSFLAGYGWAKGQIQNILNEKR